MVGCLNNLCIVIVVFGIIFRICMNTDRENFVKEDMRSLTGLYMLCPYNTCTLSGDTCLTAACHAHTIHAHY